MSSLLESLLLPFLRCCLLHLPRHLSVRTLWVSGSVPLHWALELTLSPSSLFHPHFDRVSKNYFKRRVLNLSRENRRPVSRPAQVKTFLKTGGFRLSNFTLISYNVMWILTIPVLPNLRTRELPNPSWLLSHSTGHLFQSSLLLVQLKCP